MNEATLSVQKYNNYMTESGIGKLTGLDHKNSLLGITLKLAERIYSFSDTCQYAAMARERSRQFAENPVA